MFPFRDNFAGADAFSIRAAPSYAQSSQCPLLAHYLSSRLPGMPFDETPPMVVPSLLEEGRGLGLCAVAAGPISSFQGGSFSATTGRDALGTDSAPGKTECERFQVRLARPGHLLTLPWREERSLGQTTRLLKHPPNPRQSLVLYPRLETTRYILAPLSKNAPRRRRCRGIFRSRRRQSRACPGRRPHLLACCCVTLSLHDLHSANGSCTSCPKSLNAVRRTVGDVRRRRRAFTRIYIPPPPRAPASRMPRRKTSSLRSARHRVAVPSVKRRDRHGRRA